MKPKYEATYGAMEIIKITNVWQPMNGFRLKINKNYGHRKIL